MPSLYWIRTITLYFQNTSDEGLKPVSVMVNLRQHYFCP